MEEDTLNYSPTVMFRGTTWTKYEDKYIENCGFYKECDRTPFVYIAPRNYSTVLFLTQFQSSLILSMTHLQGAYRKLLLADLEDKQHVRV